jgi:hypothetical protein
LEKVMKNGNHWQNYINKKAGQCDCACQYHHIQWQLLIDQRTTIIWVFCPNMEDGCDMFLWNVGSYKSCIASHPEDDTLHIVWVLMDQSISGGWLYNLFHPFNLGEHRSTVAWSATLQAGRSWVRVPMM